MRLFLFFCKRKGYKAVSRRFSGDAISKVLNVPALDLDYVPMDKDKLEYSGKSCFIIFNVNSIFSILLRQYGCLIRQLPGQMIKK